MEAWARLAGVQPRPWEVDTLAAMDAARRVALQPPGSGVQDTGFRQMADASDPKAAMALFDRMGGGE
jgi:hypothetical protein